jgi:hypothetical protein
MKLAVARKMKKPAGAGSEMLAKRYQDRIADFGDLSRGDDRGWTGRLGVGGWERAGGTPALPMRAWGVAALRPCMVWVGGREKARWRHKVAATRASESGNRRSKTKRGALESASGRKTKFEIQIG